MSYPGIPPFNLLSALAAASCLPLRNNQATKKRADTLSESRAVPQLAGSLTRRFWQDEDDDEDEPAEDPLGIDQSLVELGSGRHRLNDIHADRVGELAYRSREKSLAGSRAKRQGS